VADRSVRLARPDDAERVAAVQAAAWRASWSDLVPAEALAVLDSAEAADAWRAAVATPPTTRHRVLVAEDGAAVVGMAALGPAEDGDLSAAEDAELVALAVEPARRHQGHGSRLLTAAAEIARGDGFRHACAWLPATDDAGRAFLLGAGWAPDGAHRELDGGGGRQVRLHTDISEVGA
jgi:GNAT superfamily N-acetyltransferase